MSKELKKLVVNELISDYKGVNNFIVVSLKGVNTQQANVFNATASSLCRVLHAIKEKKG